jgi:hypothetical protein
MRLGRDALQKSLPRDDIPQMIDPTFFPDAILTTWQVML